MSSRDERYPGWELEEDGWHWRGHIPYDGQPKPRFPDEFDPVTSYAAAGAPLPTSVEEWKTSIAQLYSNDYVETPFVPAPTNNLGLLAIKAEDVDPATRYLVILPPPTSYPTSKYQVKGWIWGIDIKYEGVLHGDTYIVHDDQLAVW